MKLVAVDMQDREGPGYDDKLIAENVNEHYAEQIKNLLNADDCSNYYIDIKPDDYKLKIFEP